MSDTARTVILENVEWRCPSCGNRLEDGPGIVVGGSFDGRGVDGEPCDDGFHPTAIPGVVLGVRLSGFYPQGGDNRMSDEDRLQRIEYAIRVMAAWLVQAQTGFGELDARGINEILDGKLRPAAIPPTEESSHREEPSE